MSIHHSLLFERKLAAENVLLNLGHFFLQVFAELHDSCKHFFEGMAGYQPLREETRLDCRHPSQVINISVGDSLFVLPGDAGKNGTGKGWHKTTDPGDCDFLSVILKSCCAAHP